MVQDDTVAPASAPDHPEPALGMLGWREWVSLPLLGVDWLKAKVDTGARTSALHAVELELFDQDDVPSVRFVVHPWQESEQDALECVAPLVDARDVRSSSGHAEERPVIATEAVVGRQRVSLELTLTRRDDMGFRMLLGRQALIDRFLVDSSRSYVGGRPPKAVRARNRERA